MGVSSRSLSGEALINLRWYRRRRRKVHTLHVRSFQIQGWSQARPVKHINRAPSLSHPFRLHLQMVVQCSSNVEPSLLEQQRVIMTIGHNIGGFRGSKLYFLNQFMTINVKSRCCSIGLLRPISLSLSLSYRCPARAGRNANRQSYNVPCYCYSFVQVPSTD